MNILSKGTSTLDLRLTRQSIWILWGFVAVILLSRFLSCRPLLDGPESVNFALALHQYDLTALQPHLPGFPVYLFFARLFSLVGISDALSLILPGLLSAAFAVFPLFQLTRRCYGITTAYLALVLYTLHPGLWIAAVRPSYHAFLLFPFFFGLRMLLRSLLLPTYLRQKTRFLGLYAGALFLSLLSGIEGAAILFLPTLFGFALYGYIRLKRPTIFLESLNGVIAGFSVWAIPFFFTVSIGDIISVGAGLRSYTYLPPLSSEAFSIPAKGVAFLWNFFQAGFGADFSVHPFRAGMITLVTGLSLLFFLFSLRPVLKVLYLPIFILPYTLWIFFQGNLLNSSATLLSQAAAVIFMAVGLERMAFLWLKQTVVVFLILLFSLVSLEQSVENRRRLPPQREMAEMVSRLGPPEALLLFCGPSVRLFKHIYPDYLCFGIRSINEIEIFLQNPEGRTILLTSEVDGVDGDRSRFEPMGCFAGNEGLYGKENKIILYRLRSSPP